MRILIITQYFWPEQFRINDLAVELCRRGHAVEVLTGVPNYPTGKFFPGYGMFHPRRERHDGVSIVRAPLFARGQKRPWQLALNYLSFAFSASVIGPLWCHGHVDAIFVFEPSPMTVGIPAVLMKGLRRAPIVFWLQDLWPESVAAAGGVRAAWILRGIAAMVRFIYRRCDRLLVQSRGFIPSVVALGGARERIVYIPNWAEELYQPVTLAARAPERQELPKGFCVVFAGNIGEAQDFQTILRAAEKLRDFPTIHIAVFGEGRMRRWVEQEIPSRGLAETLHLMGSRPMERMPQYFAAADALLVTLRPDPVFAVTIPGKVQSALASGKPIVAAMQGDGAAVITEAKAGFVAPAGDADALAAAIQRMAECSQEERLAMGVQARAYYEKHFDRTMLIDRIETILRGL